MNLKDRIEKWIKENPGQDQLDVAMEFDLDLADANQFCMELIKEGKLVGRPLNAVAQAQKAYEQSIELSEQSDAINNPL